MTLIMTFEENDSHQTMVVYSAGGYGLPLSNPPHTLIVAPISAYTKCDDDEL